MASFWSNAPLPSFLTVIWDHIQGIAGHRSASATLRRLPATAGRPSSIPAGCLLADSKQQIQEFTDFLRAHYHTGRDPSAFPISSLTPKDVADLHLRPVLLYLPAGPSKQPTVAGCISSQPLGQLVSATATAATAKAATFNARLISNYCVHPSLRKKGHGSKLLNAVWVDTAALGEDATLFLKEGGPLLNAGPALYASKWMYRQICGPAEPTPQVAEVPVASSVSQIAEFAKAQAQTQISGKHVIYNIPIRPSSTRLYIYKGIRGYILAAFTPAYQVHSIDRKPIIYQTGWLEKGDILPMERLAAARQLSAAAAAAFAAGWVWMDQASAALQPPWRSDGPFQYYAFHWTPGIYGSVNLFLMM
jgi:hypothetical protein